MARNDELSYCVVHEVWAAFYQILGFALAVFGAEFTLRRPLTRLLVSSPLDIFTSALAGCRENSIT